MPDDMPSQWHTPATTVRAAPQDGGDLTTVIGGNMPPSLRMLLDDRLFERVKDLARLMSNDSVFTPKHLRDKPAACLNVIQQALDWRMNPSFVARGTYETPAGQVGFMGTLVQGILNQSGRFKEPPRFEYTGEWAKIAGKFQMVDSSNGKSKYPRATWTDKDAEGMGVRVVGWMTGEREPRYWPSRTDWLYVAQCQPRNSPLWATDPRTQIAYLAIRRFASQACPEVMGGMLFDVDEFVEASELARDVTPRTERPQEDRDRPTVVDHTSEPEPWSVVTTTGEAMEFRSPEIAVEAFGKIIVAAAKQNALNLVRENNDALIARLEEVGRDDLVSLMLDLIAQHEPKEQPITETHPPVPEGEGNSAPFVEASAETPDSPNGPSGEPSSPEPTPIRAEPDRFWSRESLRLDPPNDPTKRSRMPMWKQWPALILPKARQAGSRQMIDALWADNGENLDLYGQACGEAAKAELIAEFDARRETLK